MQKRHFELIAKVIKELPTQTTKKEVALRMVDALTHTNINFKPTVFKKACGIYDE